MNCLCHHRIDRLETELEAARQKLAALTGSNENLSAYPLTLAETKLYRMIVAGRTAHAMRDYYTASSETNPKVVDILVCKIRKKLPEMINPGLRNGMGCRLNKYPIKDIVAARAFLASGVLPVEESV